MFWGNSTTLQRKSSSTGALTSSSSAGGSWRPLTGWKLLNCTETWAGRPTQRDWDRAESNIISSKRVHYRWAGSISTSVCIHETVCTCVEHTPTCSTTPAQTSSFTSVGFSLFCFRNKRFSADLVMWIHLDIQRTQRHLIDRFSWFNPKIHHSCRYVFPCFYSFSS